MSEQDELISLHQNGSEGEKHYELSEQSYRNSSLSSSFFSDPADSDYQPSDELMPKKRTRSVYRVRPRQQYSQYILPAQPQSYNDNPLIPYVQNSKEIPEVYSHRLQTIIMQLNYNYNGYPYPYPSGEKEDELLLIKKASAADLLATAIQLAYRPNVCRICMQNYSLLTNLITTDLRKQAFPLYLPDDNAIYAFLRIIQAFGYQRVALHDNFIDSKVGMLCNYIAKYDKNCIDAETQALAKNIVAGLKEEFNKKKDEYEGVTRMGVDYEEALEVGKTRENRREAITINYEGPKGQGAREARRLQQMGKGTQWAIQESKKMK